MLVQQGEERGNDVDQRLACTLAAVAGALNAAAFEARRLNRSDTNLRDLLHALVEEWRSACRSVVGAGQSICVARYNSRSKTIRMLV